MGDTGKSGWPDIEPLPALPKPSRPAQAPPDAPKPPPPAAPPPPSRPPRPGTPPPPAPGFPYPPSFPPPPGGGSPDTKAWWITGILAGLVLVIPLVAVGISSDERDEPGSPPTSDVAAAPDPASDKGVATGEATPTTTTPATTPAPAPPPTDPPPPPPEALGGFGNGSFVVGQDIQPGVYITEAGYNCYWERRSGTGGTLDEINANDNAAGHAIVEILSSDVGFHSSGCDGWVPYVPPPAPATTFGDGDWAVGEQVVPGTYRADPPGDLCYWERASGFTHDLIHEVITNEFAESDSSTITINAGERFTTRDCGEWVPV